MNSTTMGEALTGRFQLKDQVENPVFGKTSSGISVP